jgi:hypothetical protein
MAYTFDLSDLAIPGSADLCFVHACDSHVTDAASTQIISDAVQAINSIAPAFVVFGGDLANEGWAESYQALRSATAGLGSPACFVPGNHDLADAKRPFMEHLGPLNQAFDAGPCHCICLDSTGPTQLTWGGLFTGAAIAWLEDHLRAVAIGTPIILFTHHGIRSEQPHAPLENLLWDVLNYKPIHAALAPHNLILTCAGHAHENVVQQWGRTTMTWSGVLSQVRENHVPLPPGFRVVWLQGESVGTHWVPATPV